MRNFLMTTTAAGALACAGFTVAGPASAADMLSVGVGGYMQQWFGMSSVDDDDDKITDGTAQQSDSEVFFRGSLESDSGLTFSVKVELEGNNADHDHGYGADGEKTKKGGSSTAIDESQLTIGGSFGKITLGAEDPASTLTHHGGLDVGVSLNCGDTHKWIGGLAGCSHNGFGTYGHGHGDKNQIMYMSPRVSGVQFGVSYVPDTSQETSNKALNENATDAWAIGGNYVGDLGGDLAVEFSLGHYQASQVGTATDLKSGMGDNAITVGTYMSNNDAIDRLADALAGNTITHDTNDDNTPDTLQELQVAAGTAETSNAGAFDMKGMKKADDKTFSNAALQVGFGSFKFGVVYATNDGGAYKVEKNPIVVNANAGFANSAATCAGTGTAISDSAAYCFTTTDEDATDVDTGTDGIQVRESADVNDPNNDMARTMFVKNKSANWDTWGAGVKYSDGPMAMSLSHLATEWDDGGEQEATMLSLSYTLAPGVASKTSIFTAERSMASGRKIDGTAFVTGIAIGF